MNLVISKMAENGEVIIQEDWLGTIEGEVMSVLEQIEISTKRNSIESFRSLEKKVFLCGRQHYLIKLLVGGMETFLKIRKIQLKEEFDRVDYVGTTDMKEKLAETNVMRRMNQKLQLVKGFVDMNRAVFDRYENDLQTEQFEIPEGDMESIQSYMIELRRHHTTMDNLLTIYLKLQKRVKISKDAIKLLDDFRKKKHKELQRLGQASTIKKLPITRIELFKNGDIHWVKVNCNDQGQNRGWLASLESSKININPNLLD